MKAVRLLVAALWVVFPGLASASTMHAPTACEAPIWLKAMVGELKSCQCVDFTGDGVADYIALGATSRVEDKRKGTPLGDEWWVTSDRRVVVKRPRWHSGHHYVWFARLDRGPEPVIISADGDAEGIEYTLQRLDLVTGVFEVLFYFEPVVVERDGQLYHGYPWDVTDLLTEGAGSDTKLIAAVRPRAGPDADHGDPGMGDNGSMPATQKMVPLIFFTGHSTQPEAKLGHVDRRGFHLADLIRLANGG